MMMEVNGSVWYGDSVVMEWLFVLGVGMVVGGGENDVDDGLGVWLSESEFGGGGGGARGKSNAVGANGECGRFFVFVVLVWEELLVEKLLGGWRWWVSCDGEEWRWLEDLFEELLINVERGASARDFALVMMEVVMMMMVFVVNICKEGDYMFVLVLMDFDWNDEDEDS